MTRRSMTCSRHALALTAVVVAAGILGGPATAAAQQTVAEREDARERGIRRITEIRHAISSGRVTTESEPWGYVEYDRRGNQLITGRFTSDGRDSPMYVREYDADDRPIRRTFYIDRTDENPLGRPCLVFRDYRLDDHGNVAEENGYDLDGAFVVRVTFRRDPDGRTLDRQEHFGDGSPRNRSYRYSYNEVGDAVESLTFDAEGELIETRRTAYTYDADGRVIAWRTTDGEGSLTGSGRQSYDEDGNRIESLDRDASGTPIRVWRFVYESWE